MNTIGYILFALSHGFDQFARSGILLENQAGIFEIVYFTGLRFGTELKPEKNVIIVETKTGTEPV